MRRVRLLWQLFSPFLLITLFSLLALGWAASYFFHQFFLEQQEIDLAARARLAAHVIDPALRNRQYPLVDATCKHTGRDSRTRITIILPDGRVIGDSEEQPAQMENHADRPEVREALRGGTGQAIRFSRTLGEKMMYVAVPTHGTRGIIGIVRAAVPLTAVEQALRTMRHSLIAGWLIVAVLAAGASLLISRRISRPLEALKRGAQRFARGELDTPLPIPDSEEIGKLAEAMNQMAVRLDERIRAITRQRNEQDAVLAGMSEGVFAVDSNEQVFKLNQAAAQLVGIDAEQAAGRSLQEVIRHTELQRFVAMVLASREPLEAEMILRRDDERIMQVHGTPLYDEAARRMGAVVVLTDITRLRRLERIRRDFVANVSHELKTPITSIKGFVETLQDGALRQPDDAEHFLQIIARHADRLEAIIEDLLSLSRIEQEAETAVLRLDDCAMTVILQNAVQACELKAGAKEITITLECPDELRARVNPALLEQALVNLLDNALKYSEPHSRIELTATRIDDNAVISVRDHGSGIPTEHLPRLFERFYRVDKGRSRKLGGTGLGLAIVKHIAQAHGGHVTVESTVGHGSLFTLYLPHLAGQHDEK